jgi:hypothetical protein
MRVAVILFIIFITSTGWAETYRWVDERGTENFTSDYGSIPEKYRDQVKTKRDEPGAKPKIDEKTQKTLKKDIAKGSQKSSGKDRTGEQKSNKRRIESDAAETLQTIISFWKDEKYEALYEYGTRNSRAGMAREIFIHKMEKKGWGLASSWETIQNIDAESKSPTVVYVTGKIGHKSKQGGNIKILTETFQMKLENGVWKTDLSKILQAPSGDRKAARHRR